MLHALAPGHLRDVNQSFDAGSEFNKGPVVRNVHDLPADANAREVLIWNESPRIRLELFVAEGHTLLFAIIFEDLDGDFITDLEKFRRVIHAAPRKVGNVQQSVDPAQVNEHTVVGDVLHRAADFGVLAEDFKGECLPSSLLALDDALA